MINLDSVTKFKVSPKSDKYVHATLISLETSVKNEDEKKAAEIANTLQEYLNQWGSLGQKQNSLVSISNFIDDAIFFNINPKIIKILYDCLPNKNNPIGFREALLTTAIKNEKTNLVDFLLLDGFDVSEIAISGHSPLIDTLMYCSKNKKLLDIIMSYNPDIFYRQPQSGWSAIIYAIDTNVPDIIDKIMNHAKSWQDKQKLIAELSLEESDFIYPNTQFSIVYSYYKEKRLELIEKLKIGIERDILSGLLGSIEVSKNDEKTLKI